MGCLFDVFDAPWQLTAIISGPLTLLSAASATGTLMLARRAQDHASLEAREGASEARLAQGDAHTLLEAADRSHSAAFPAVRTGADPAKVPRDA